MIPLGVVDPTTLKVYGTSNLRVVDASIIPLIPATHPVATIYAIAERVGGVASRTKYLTISFLAGCRHDQGACLVGCVLGMTPSDRSSYSIHECCTISGLLDGEILLGLHLRGLYVIWAASVYSHSAGFISDLRPSLNRDLTTLGHYDEPSFILTITSTRES